MHFLLKVHLLNPRTPVIDDFFAHSLRVKVTYFFINCLSKYWLSVSLESQHYIFSENSGYEKCDNFRKAIKVIHKSRTYSINYNTNNTNALWFKFKISK